jgi:hypothetical protein
MPEVVKPANIIKDSLALSSSEDMFHDTYFIKARILVNVKNKKDKQAAVEWLTHLLRWLKRKPKETW